jgi:peptidoglycan/LPS O-acetylase OafA/YrhL
MNWKVNYDKRIYGLDVYRAIAILVVVQSHSSFMLNGTFMENFPWIALVDGVELFFVLSGFLIGSILLKIIEQNDYSLSFPLLFTFWKRRWFRTLPNYYLILIIYTLFVSQGIIEADISQFNYTFFLFLQNFASPFYNFFWESWSLSVEEWFYIITPVLLLLVLKLIPNRKGILSVIILLILAPLVYRISVSHINVDQFWWDVSFRKVVIMRLDTVIYGVLAAYIKYYHASFWKKAAIPGFILGLLLIFILPSITTDPNAFFTKTFYFSLISIAAMLLLPFADSVKKFKTRFGKWITHISLISYSMYLINFGLGISIIETNFPIENTLDGTIKYFLFWIYVLVTSTLLYFGFELPVMSLRDRSFRDSFKK